MTANLLLAERVAKTLIVALATRRIRRLTPTTIHDAVTNDPSCPPHPRNRADTVDLARRLIAEATR